MALSAAERDAVINFIISFIEGEFGRVLTHYYAAGVAYSARHPSNINNELRNALTHMSRALAADDYGAAEKELTAASRHIERFKRDCLKVAVIYSGRNASQMLRHAEITYGRVDPNLALEVFSLATRKYQVLASEVLGDDHAAAKWETLFLDIERLREKALQSYRLLDTRKYWFPLLFIRLWRWTKWVGGAFIIAIIGMAIWAVMVPDQESFGKKGQEFLAHYLLDVTAAPHGVASTPSSGATPASAPPPKPH